jgi:hypothetical protein
MTDSPGARPVDAEGRAATPESYDGFISSNYMKTQRDCGLSADELVLEPGIEQGWPRLWVNFNSP